MNAQAGANTPGWLHHPATQFGQASTDVLEKKMTENERTVDKVYDAADLREMELQRLHGDQFRSYGEQMGKARDY